MLALLGDGEAFALVTVTPLLHTNLLPLFTHVYRLPETVDTCPAFLQTPPALVAAMALVGVIKAKITTSASNDLFIGGLFRVFTAISTTPSNTGGSYLSFNL